jgi:hypothetical protein
MNFGAPSRQPAHDHPKVRLLRADRDLAEQLTGPRLLEATERLVVRAFAARAGTLTDRAQRIAGPDGLGLLMLDGVIARELLLSDNVSVELLGAGDLLQDAPRNDPGRLLRTQVRLTVVEPARVAVLDHRFAQELARYPEVNSALIARLVQRSHRLAVTHAIAQLNGVDRRALALFWHLAERWGQITGAGVELPLQLPHRMIAQLVGARRPTISSALANLSGQGLLSRRPDGGWILHGDPVGLPDEAACRAIALRRRRARRPAEHATESGPARTSSAAPAQ